MATNGGPKLLVGILSAILVTGLVAWFTFGNRVATAQDLEKTEKVIATQMTAMSENCGKKHDHAGERIDDLEDDAGLNAVEHQKLTDAIKGVETQLAHQNKDMEDLKKGQQRMINAVNKAVAERVLVP